MSEKIIPFLPRGGNEAREQRVTTRRAEEQKNLDSLVGVAGFVTDEPFSLRKESEYSLATVVSLWSDRIHQYELANIPVDTSTSAYYEGRSISAEATLDQVRLGLADHLRLIDAGDTAENIEDYWSGHPIIQLYLNRVKGVK